MSDDEHQKRRRKKRSKATTDDTSPNGDSKASEKSRRRRSRKLSDAPINRAGDLSDSSGRIDRSKVAKDAFKNRDAEASRALHAQSSVAEGGHQKGGEYIKSIVYGAMDGLITTFSVVSAVVGGNLAIGTVLIMGFANMLGDGISMGIGDFLSSRAEIKFAIREREREMWECDNDIEAERREMIELYSMKEGIDEEGAKKIVEIISKNYDTFVDIMMVEELGLMPPDPDDSPMKNGFVTFLPFIVVGVIPLLPYVGAVSVSGPQARATGADPAFIIAIVLSGVTMFGLGAVTSRFTSEQWYMAGGVTLLNGALAAGASYLIAFLVNLIFDVEL